MNNDPNRKSIDDKDNLNDIEVKNMDSYSRDLELCLESPGMTWNDIQETVSMSLSSLEGNSSGYNSSSIDNTLTKNKRDSDSFSASSKSESSELNCIVARLKATLDEFESANNNKQEGENNCKDKIYDPEDNIHFHLAVRNGNFKRVEELINNELIENLDEPDWNISGDPPLLIAATNLSLPILSILLSSRCNPNGRSPRGETALHRIILNGNPENIFKFVKELLEFGCSPGIKEAGGGLTALHILTRQIANINHLSSENFDESLKTLEILAKSGAVNDKDHQGRTALHILASSTKICDDNYKVKIESLIKILIDAGADAKLKNDRGETPLHESLECGGLITANILMGFTSEGLISRYGETPLHIAARKNYIEIVEKLLENGEDPNLQDARGNTPLHLTSARGYHQIVSLLIKSPRIQLEKLNSDGLTALMIAAESGFINAVKLLVKAGANSASITNFRIIQHRHPDILDFITRLDK